MMGPPSHPVLTSGIAALHLDNGHIANLPNISGAVASQCFLPCCWLTFK